MKSIFVVIAAALVGVVLLLGQRQKAEVPAHPQMEILSVFPNEFTPGQFQQVEQRRLETLADQGWELVSVMPYVYLCLLRGRGCTQESRIHSVSVTGE